MCVCVCVCVRVCVCVCACVCEQTIICPTLAAGDRCFEGLPPPPHTHTLYAVPLLQVTGAFRVPHRQIPRISAHTHKHTRAHAHTHTHTHTLCRTLAAGDRCLQGPTQTDPSHLCTHTHTHTNTHTHTHTHCVAPLLQVTGAFRAPHRQIPRISAHTHTHTHTHCVAPLLQVTGAFRAPHRQIPHISAHTHTHTHTHTVSYPCCR